MSVEIAFPIEFVVEGVPASLGASGATRLRWKEKVAGAAKPHLPEGHFATGDAVAVSIFYFPEGGMIGDIDNIAKPILDALCPLIYLDDRQVERLLIQKFERMRSIPNLNPTPTLLEVLEGPRPVVYIRVDGGYDAGDAPW